MKTILVDKSAFQALPNEIRKPPGGGLQILGTDVLVLEILGDTERHSDSRAMGLARKFNRLEPVIGPPFHELCVRELLGGSVPMENRPVLAAATTQSSPAQASGTQASQLQAALSRFCQRQFTAQDRRAAAQWASGLRDETSRTIEEQARSAIGEERRPKDLASVMAAVAVADNRLLFEALLGLLQVAGARRASVQAMRARWLVAGSPSLKTYAPYADYCGRAVLLYTGAVASRVFGTRPSDLVDFLYLLYLPFCDVFSSNDGFHKRAFPAMKQSAVALVEGNDLAKMLDGTAEVSQIYNTAVHRTRFARR